MHTIFGTKPGQYDLLSDSVGKRWDVVDVCAIATQAINTECHFGTDDKPPLVGFDDIDRKEYISPTLTQPSFQLFCLCVSYSFLSGVERERADSLFEV